MKSLFSQNGPEAPPPSLSPRRRGAGQAFFRFPAQPSACRFWRFLRPLWSFVPFVLALALALGPYLAATVQAAARTSGQSVVNPPVRAASKTRTRSVSKSSPKSAARGKAQTRPDREDPYRELEMFANVLTLVQQYYVDETGMRSLVRGAVEGMLTSLDPHSGYLSPEDYQELEEETSGSFTGVGIEVTIRDETLTTVAPIEGTPADRAGLRPGDRIMRIDGLPTKNMGLMEAMKKMRGPKGSSVTLSIRRDQWRGMRDFTLVREEIPLVSVKAEELEPGYGYIRITNFQDATTEDLLTALGKLREKGALRGLVLDLRNNPGGLLDQAIKVADVFLDHGVIVSTRGRNNQEQILYEAHPDTRVENYPMAVLINGGSASGSEIVAGALKDHKRARIVGTTSFGKGSVQTIVPLPNGAAIRLTTARYYTPSGASIQATGIRPDVEVPLNLPPDLEAENQPALRERDLPGHLENDTAQAKKRGKGRNKGERGGGTGPAGAAGLGESAQDEAFQRVSGIADIKKRLEQDNQLRRALELIKR